MLLPRQAAIFASPNCYAVCNYGFVKFQALGYQPALCQLDYLATTYVEICGQCVTPNTTISPTPDILNDVLIYCSVSSSSTTSAASTTTGIVTKRASITTPLTLGTITTTLQSSASSSLSGLVPCPSRITNSYTPATPLPTDYLWGCPPGKICAPENINCNFNFALADSYICEPENCQTPDPLPAFNDDVARWNQTNYTIQPIAVAGNLMNLNPTPFGLNFDIFDVDGQPVFGASVSSTTPGGLTNTLSTTSSTSISTLTPTSPQQSSSYTGTKLAGTIAGPILAVLIALIVLVLFMRRRQKRRKTAAAVVEETRNGKPQLDATEAEIKRKELSGVHVNEVSNDTQREELLGRCVAELGPAMDPPELDTAFDRPFWHNALSPKEIKRKPLPNALGRSFLYTDDNSTLLSKQVKRKPLPNPLQ